MKSATHGRGRHEVVWWQSQLVNACLLACLSRRWLAGWLQLCGRGGAVEVEVPPYNSMIVFPRLLIQCLSQSWNGVESQHEALSSQVRRLTSNTDTFLRRCKDDVKICVPDSSTFAQYGPNAAFPGLVEIINHRGLCSCLQDVACSRRFPFYLRQLSSFLTPPMYFHVCLLLSSWIYQEFTYLRELLQLRHLNRFSLLSYEWLVS